MDGYQTGVRWEWYRNQLLWYWYRLRTAERCLLSSLIRILSDQHLNHLEDAIQPRLLHVAPVHQPTLPHLQ